MIEVVLGTITDNKISILAVNDCDRRQLLKLLLPRSGTTCGVMSLLNAYVSVSQSADPAKVQPKARGTRRSHPYKETVLNRL